MIVGPRTLAVRMGPKLGGSRSAWCPGSGRARRGLVLPGLPTATWARMATTRRGVAAGNAPVLLGGVESGAAFGWMRSSYPSHGLHMMVHLQR